MILKKLSFCVRYMCFIGLSLHTHLIMSSFFTNILYLITKMHEQNHYILIQICQIVEERNKLTNINCPNHIA